MPTRVGRHVQNIQNRSSTGAPQSCSKTDLPNSPSTDVSCCLPARISRVLQLRIQSCSLESNLIAVQTCVVVQVSSTCLLRFLSLWISTSVSPSLCLEFWAAACTNNQYLGVRTFRSFDTHPRIASALLSSCPCRIFLCLSIFGRRHRLQLNLHRVFPAEVVLKMRLLFK